MSFDITDYLGIKRGTKGQMDSRIKKMQLQIQALQLNACGPLATKSSGFSIRKV